MNENDFVVGVLTYITCLREKKRLFHGEELSRCVEVV